MQTEWIRAFVLLKEKMNFAEAAEEMFVSASSFSKYIKALENELGVTLVDRSRHRLCLTREGEAVYPHAVKALEACLDMLQAAQKEREGASGELRVCISASSNTSVYIRHILSFFEVRPQLRLSLHEYKAADARKAFLDGSLDMLIGYTGLFSDLTGGDSGEECALLVLRQEELFFAGSDPHVPDAVSGDSSSIPLEQALSGRLILHRNTWSELQRLPVFSGAAALSEQSVVTTTSTDVLKAYLLSGAAHSLLSVPMLRALNLENRLFLVPVSGHPTLSLGLLYRPARLDKAGRELLESLRQIRTE